MMKSPVQSKHAPAIPTEIEKKNQSANPPNQSESHIQKQCFRTKMCTFFYEGKCNKGSACSFAHNSEQLKDKPDFKKTRLCSAHNQRKCTKSANDCPFAHGEADLRKHRGPLKGYFESQKSSISKPERSGSDGLSTPTTFPRSSSTQTEDLNASNQREAREETFSPLSSPTGLDQTSQFLVPSNNRRSFNDRSNLQYNPHHLIHATLRSCDSGQGSKLMQPVSPGYQMIPMLNRRPSGINRQDDGGFTDAPVSSIDHHSGSTISTMSPINFAVSPAFPPSVYSSGDPNYYNGPIPFVNASIFVSPNGFSSPNMNMNLMHSPNVMLQSSPNIATRDVHQSMMPGYGSEELAHPYLLSPGFPCDYSFNQGSYDLAAPHAGTYDQQNDQ